MKEIYIVRELPWDIPEILAVLGDKDLAEQLQTVLTTSDGCPIRVECHRVLSEMPKVWYYESWVGLQSGKELRIRKLDPPLLASGAGGVGSMDGIYTAHAFGATLQETKTRAEEVRAEWLRNQNESQEEPR